MARTSVSKTGGTGAKAGKGAEPKPKSAKQPAGKAGAEPSAALAPDRPAEPAAVFKIKTLLDLVAARSGAKKKEAKPVVEAVLAELGAALSRGDTLALPPLGRARVARTAGDTLVIKLKRAADEKEGSPPLAPGQE